MERTEVKICFLYGDLMNLYGDYANIKKLSRDLSEQGVNAIIENFSIGSTPSLSEYDLVYIGSGTERAFFTALNAMKRIRSEFVKALKNKVIFLCTGISFELFGKSITDENGNIHEGLNIFPFESEFSKKRFLCDAVASWDKNNIKTVGFINTASNIKGITSPWFNILAGRGNGKVTEDDSGRGEGICIKTFYGTHLTGPLLIKNPHIAEYFVTLILKSKHIEYVPFPHEHEQKAYKTTYEALKDRFGLDD